MIRPAQSRQGQRVLCKYSPDVRMFGGSRSDAYMYNESTHEDPHYGRPGVRPGKCEIDDARAELSIRHLHSDSLPSTSKGHAIMTDEGGWTGLWHWQNGKNY